MGGRKEDPLAALRISPTPENIARFKREREFHDRTFRLIHAFMGRAMQTGQLRTTDSAVLLFEALDDLQRHLGMICHSDEIAGEG